MGKPIEIPNHIGEELFARAAANTATQDKKYFLEIRSAQDSTALTKLIMSALDREEKDAIEYLSEQYQAATEHVCMAAMLTGCEVAVDGDDSEFRSYLTRFQSE
jgi:hypothetical protein